MSRSFTYQLDEKMLKAKLRDIAIPLNADAWQWFDLHAAIEKPLPVKRLTGFRLRLPEFSFKLDRRIITSSVLALVILIFASTLVSFLNFDNAARARETTIATAAQPKEKSVAASPATWSDQIELRVADIRVNKDVQPVVAAEEAAPKPVARKQSPHVAKADPRPSTEPIVADPLPVLTEPVLPTAEEPELR